MLEFRVQAIAAPESQPPSLRDGGRSLVRNLQDGGSDQGALPQIRKRLGWVGGVDLACETVAVEDGVGHVQARCQAIADPVDSLDPLLG